MSINKPISSVKGMNDILPEQISIWNKVESCLKKVTAQFSFHEIRFPIVEKTQLFKRSIGDLTDIVQKEMYTFEDQHNGDLLTLRPEGTAPCVRACQQNSLLYNQIQRLWYLGPMFRHEKPQKGRYRQFYQFGVEAFGYDNVAIELELLSMTQKFWQELGIDKVVTLEINTIGTIFERLAYQEALKDFLFAHKDVLDEESLIRLDKNPLRILDSKNPAIQKLLEDAPILHEYLSKQSRQRFKELCTGLDLLNIKYIHQPKLVRGLDYYSHTVFEWVTELLGAQSTVCAGGRYDGLVEQLGGKATPAAGFAIGIERLVLLLEELELVNNPKDCDLYVVIDKSVNVFDALVCVDKIRNAYNNLAILTDLSASSIKSQIKRANNHKSDYCLQFTSDDFKQGLISIKAMSIKSEMQLLTLEQLIKFLG